MKKIKLLVYPFVFFSCLLLAIPQAFAQVEASGEIDESEIINLEQEYAKPRTQAPRPAPQEIKPATPEGSEAQDIINQAAPVVETNEVKEFKDLGRLAPFREISVIQKRFLPKTGRFQFFAGASLVTNQPWFLQGGLNLRLGYNFLETLGIELSHSAMGNSERQVTKEAYEEHGIKADVIAYAKSFSGVLLQWSPIYGKMSWFNSRIIPFDLYFNLGGGPVAVSGGSNTTGLQAGTGQVFAISKAMAFRWDFSLLTYEINSNLEKNTRRNDLLITAGISVFWPEASYR